MVVHILQFNPRQSFKWDPKMYPASTHFLRLLNAISATPVFPGLGIIDTNEIPANTNPGQTDVRILFGEFKECVVVENYATKRILITAPDEDVCDRLLAYLHADTEEDLAHSVRPPLQDIAFC